MLWSLKLFSGLVAARNSKQFFPRHARCMRWAPPAPAFCPTDAQALTMERYAAPRAVRGVLLSLELLGCRFGIQGKPSLGCQQAGLWKEEPETETLGKL